jgi:hypothetical protein
MEIKCHSNPQFPRNGPNLTAVTADFGNITRQDAIHNSGAAEEATTSSDRK